MHSHIEDAWTGPSQAALDALDPARTAEVLQKEELLVRLYRHTVPTKNLQALGPARTCSFRS